ncbi:g3713 [Coccomyxa elongata]
MGTGTQTHIIFPRRAIPGVSWSPPLERADVPRPDAEGSREFATILAERKAALEASPQQPPSPEAAARQQGSPSELAQASVRPSPRSETASFTMVDSPSGGAAEPASIGSLIQKFEQAQQAAPKERTGLSPRAAPSPSNGRAPERVHKEVQISSPSKPKWWQRLGRSKSRGAVQGLQEPKSRVDEDNAEAYIGAIELPEVSSSPRPKKPRRVSGNSAAPIMTWYRACVSAPETPPALFIEDNAPPLSARIAAHRGNPTDPPSIRPDAAINNAPSEVEATRPLTTAHGDSNALGCSPGPKKDADAGPRAAQAGAICNSLGQCIQAEDDSKAGQRAAEDIGAAAFVHGRSGSLGQSLEADADGEAGRKSAEAASLDIWLLPKEELSVRSVQQGRGNAAPQTLDLSPRTPEVVRESAAASALPAARSSRLSRPPASAPGEPSAGDSAQVDEDPDAATGAAVNERTRLSWPTAMEESAARKPAQAEVPARAGDAAETVPKTEASEQLEAVRQLADQAAHVQRRARRLLTGRTRQKVTQGLSGSPAAQAADTSRKRASNTSPPPKCARRKDGQRSRTPSPEKVHQLLSEVTAVSEELRARSGRLGTHAAILGDLQSGIEAVRARLRTPSSSPPESDAAPEQEPSAAARASFRPPPASHAPVAEEHQAATVVPGEQQPSAEAFAGETGAPADVSEADRPAESAQPAPAPLLASIDAQPEPVQPEHMLEAETHAREGRGQAQDRVAEAAARAHRAITARRAAQKEMVSVTEEGTPSPEALQRSALDLARLSTAALTTSMCLLVSVEQGVEISARACEVVCNSLLARVPFGSSLLRSIGDEEEAATRVQPTLAVRAIRGGIRVAYGAAGTVTGVGAGVLRAGIPLALPWRR